MNIHEYQAKALLHEFGVPISAGVPVLKASDSDAAAKKLPGPVWVVKSQIHAGGRGKGKFKEASAGDKGGVRDRDGRELPEGQEARDALRRLSQR